MTDVSLNSNEENITPTIKLEPQADSFKIMTIDEWEPKTPFERFVKHSKYAKNLMVTPAQIKRVGQKEFCELDLQRLLEFLGLTADKRSTRLVSSMKCLLVLLLDWGLGRGKSFWIRNVFVPEMKRSNYTILVVAHRQKLVRQLSDDFDLNNYQDVKVKRSKRIRGSDDPMDMVVCVNSINMISWYPDVVIIDEIEGVLAGLASDEIYSKSVKMLTNVFLKLYLILQNAKFLVMADANLDSMTLKLLNLIGYRDRMVLCNGPSRPKEFVYCMRKKHHFALIAQQVLEGKNVAVACMSKNIALELYDFLDMLPDSEKVVLIGGDPWVEEFINIEGEDKYKVRCFIYSPVIDAGVSIELEWFDCVHLFCSNSIGDSTNCLQMTARIRNPREKEIYFSGIVNNSKIMTGVTEASINDSLADNRQVSLSMIQQVQPDFELPKVTDFTFLNFILYYMFTTARRGHGWIVLFLMKNYSWCQYPEIEELGRGEIGQQIRSVSQSLKDIHAHQIQKIYEEIYDFEELQTKHNLSIEEKLALEKYRLKDFYGPELKLQSELGRWVISEDKDFILTRKTRLFAKVVLISGAYKGAVIHDEAKSLKERSLLDYDEMGLKAAIIGMLLREFKVDFLNPDAVSQHLFSVQTNEAIFEVVSLPTLSHLLSVVEFPVPTATTNVIKWMMTILDMVGLEMIGHKQRRVNGRRVREYSICKDSLNRMMFLARQEMMRLVASKLDDEDCEYLNTTATTNFNAEEVSDV